MVVEEIAAMKVLWEEASAHAAGFAAADLGLLPHAAVGRSAAPGAGALKV